MASTAVSPRPADPSTDVIPFAAAGPHRLTASMARHTAEIAFKRVGTPSCKSLFVGTLVSKATGQLLMRVEHGTQKRCRAEIEDAYVKVLAADRVHPPRLTRDFTDFVAGGNEGLVELRLKTRADVFLKRFNLRQVTIKYVREKIDGKPALTLHLVAEEIVQ